MKKLTLLLSATALAAMLVVPVGASANRGVGNGDDCAYTGAGGPANGTGEVPVGPIDVGVTTGSAGSTTAGSSDAAVGVCVDGNGTLSAGPNGPTFDGGTLEAGGGDPTTTGTSGAYVIADGDDNNVDDGSENSSKGYIGVSNFETQPEDGDRCEKPAGTPTDPDNNTSSDTGSGTNSGGCLTIRQDDPASANPADKNTIAVVPGFPLLACGNDSSGPPNDRRWENSTRDGCTLPS